jgi:hypothetical protein
MKRRSILGHFPPCIFKFPAADEIIARYSRGDGGGYNSGRKVKVAIFSHNSSAQIFWVYLASLAAAAVLAALAVLPEMIKLLATLGYGSGALIKATLWKMLASAGDVSPLAVGVAFAWRAALFTAHNETLAWATIGKHPLTLIAKQLPMLLTVTIVSAAFVFQVSPWALGKLIGILHQPSEELASGTVIRTDAETWVVKDRRKGKESGLMIRHKADGRVLFLTAGAINRQRVLNGMSLGEGRTDGKWTLMNFARMDLPKAQDIRLPMPSNSIPVWPETPSANELRARAENVLSCFFLGLTAMVAGLVWGRKGWALPLALLMAGAQRALLLALDSLATVNLICLCALMFMAPLLWKPRMYK